MKDILFFVCIAILAIIAFTIWRKTKRIKLGSLNMVTGGVKCGKSTLSVYLTIKEHKLRVRKTKVLNFFRVLFHKSKQPLPLIYSNIPLSVPYVPITKELLLRKERFVYGSVIYICESSLVADSQLYYDNDINTELLLFNKLIGHETKGGVLIYDTQSISDVHYAVKRSLSNYIYVHHLRKGIFFNVAYVMESRYSEDNSVITSIVQDVEEKDLLRKVYIPKKYWKYFDCYCYSVLTDNLPVAGDTIIVQDKDLKARNIVSFRKEIEKRCSNEKNCSCPR